MVPSYRSLGNFRHKNYHRRVLLTEIENAKYFQRQIFLTLEHFLLYRFVRREIDNAKINRRNIIQAKISQTTVVESVGVTGNMHVLALYVNKTLW